MNEGRSGPGVER